MQQVHDATGSECANCGHKFTRSSLNLTINKSEKERGSIVKQRVCGKCWNAHYDEGEKYKRFSTSEAKER
ncbi:hypothetical protein UFOVP1138_19 [uncultured Caudovirales phage]|uniref:Uncharacterized protein n=1 Tax=uncultured Caudovirales phage TaxID=2100421 RepID=A0A6J5S7A4_9CAUD|nr:hypothetical protein UFOVP975_12 [uncultured Caudovirales phage]CAB4186197.1 hypothetical protein UFOVP1138_19 [uncultured Caudovirales phage]CAB4204396.1 hypothetical protein UFOVP1394_16 [uncultured Caudovirales phage]